MRNFYQRWLPVLLWMSVIFILSSRPDLPGNKIDWVDFIIKKAAHITVFAVLTVLSYRAFQKPSPDHAVLLSLAYAFSDEIHQFFTPGRGAHLYDVAFDSLGIVIAIFVITKTKLWKKLI